MGAEAGNGATGATPVNEGVCGDAIAGAAAGEGKGVADGGASVVVGFGNPDDASCAIAIPLINRVPVAPINNAK